MTETESDPERFRNLMVDSEPEFDDIMICVFNIQRHETQAYQVLLDHPESTVAEIADRIERDRSNIHRSLRTLREKGLARRRRRVLDAGGEVYEHTPTPLPEATELMHETLDQWTAHVHSQIERFGDGESP